ncbi:hypothetical protein ABZ443_45255, partial [Streptomyces shenzhenensis]
MSESTPGAPAAGPDFLDRLIARHTAPRPAAVRVRPRLPGPFERVEAVRARTPDPDAADPVARPAAAPAPAAEAEPSRPAAAEVRRYPERERTVVRARPAPAEPAVRPVPPAPPEAPLLRPVALPAPGPSAVSRTGSRTAGWGRPEPGADRTAAPTP